MRFAVTWLIALCMVVPNYWATGAGLPLATSRSEYHNRHLIVGFKPGVPVPTNALVQARRTPFGNKVLDELKVRSALIEVQRLAPHLRPPVEGFEAALKAVAQRPPRSLQEVAALFHEYGLDRMVVLRFAQPIDPPRLAEDLMRQYPDLIEFAEPDYMVHLRSVPNDPLFRLQWHLQHRIADPARRADIRAVEAWDITTGSPDVVIAVIDTGLDTQHLDIMNKLFINPGEIPNNRIDDDGNGFVDDVSGWDFFRGDNTPNDENGHGTLVTSIAAAETNNELDVAGVSWGSRVLPLKVLDASGVGSTSAVIQALNYVVPHAAHGVRVINMSIGGGGRVLGIERALRAANDAGIAAIAAAGNGGDDGVGDNNDEFPDYPSSFSFDLDNVVAVASTDRSNRLSFFSNFGRETVDVGAPGEGIIGLAAGGTQGATSRSGTSAAAPVVSGTAALIYSQFPESTPVQVKMRLRANVDPLDALSEITVSGGRVNAFRSLIRDEVGPAPITDLRLAEGSSPPMLTWTATGDDDQEGQAAFYDIRFLSTPITPSNFRFTQKLRGVPRPQPAGATETLALPEDLIPRFYYFLIRVFDKVGNVAESQVEILIPG